MREIKLRCWDDVNCRYHFSDNPDDDCVAWIFENGSIAVYNTEEIEPGRTEVARELSGPIEEFTSLKDKNGKEIFEGDIVEAHGTPNQQIEYVNGEWSLIPDKFYLPKVHDYWTVIDNIHENPELLEQPIADTPK